MTRAVMKSQRRVRQSPQKPTAANLASLLLRTQRTERDLPDRNSERLRNMTQFVGDIAWMLELFAIAGGLVLFHVASMEPRTKFLKAAGWLLLLAGVGTALCTGYYWLSYQSQGSFDTAHGHTPMMMQMPAGSMAPDGSVGSTHRGMQPGLPPGPEERER